MRKPLGQHFLKNKKALKKIAAAAGVNDGDTIIEIGPGHGELTEELRNKNHELKIIAIEKDRRLAESLKTKFAACENIEIIAGDALKILPSLVHDPSFPAQNYKIVGNIPYYITGRLLRIIGEIEPKPVLTVLTVQKEVAERIFAKPPKMNLLAAIVQFWAEPEIVDYLPKQDFSPPPEVASAIIGLRTKNFESGIKENYYKLAKILFKQPRKTILNNLLASKTVPKTTILKNLQDLNLKPNERAQNLTIESIKALEILYN